MKIIASGNYWVCENMDTLAPIIEEGTMYLLDDGTTTKVNPGLEYATEAEKKLFASREYGTIFKGDQVVIKRGRKMLNEVKEVKGSYRFVVDGTYGKVYTDYLTFTDGTKVNIDHCDVVGVEHKNTTYLGKICYYRHYEERLSITTFNVGGRL